MRVVIAADFPEVPPDVVGGIQAIVYYTLLPLATNEALDIHIVSCEKWGKAARSGNWVLQGKGWLAHYYASAPRLPHTLSMLTVDRWKVARAIRDLRPDIVHAHGQAAAYPWAAFDSGVPTIVTVQGINALEARLDRRGGRLRSELRALLWERIERACLRRMKEVVITGPFQAEVIRPHTQARFHWIENPVQPELFDISADTIIPGQILYVGSIQKRKGLSDLIQAVHLLRDLQPPIHLRVAGGFMQPYAAYGETVRQLTERLDLSDRIHFLGHTDRSTLLEEFKHCAVFCLPTYLEGSPVAVAEAMAAGRPIVTTAIDATAHLIAEGVNGFRVPPGDPEALAARLRALLTNADLSRAFGQAARQEAIHRFSPEKAARATFEAYRKILEV
jgi:glycosyltransferase involved in cell wall biosynthesis